MDRLPSFAAAAQLTGDAVAGIAITRAGRGVRVPRLPTHPLLAEGSATLAVARRHARAPGTVSTFLTSWAGRSSASVCSTAATRRRTTCAPLCCSAQRMIVVAPRAVGPAAARCAGRGLGRRPYPGRYGSVRTFRLRAGTGPSPRVAVHGRARTARGSGRPVPAPHAVAIGLDHGEATVARSTLSLAQWSPAGQRRPAWKQPGCGT